ncbi:hypothetical protein ONR57_12710 [Hoyosella sp. YIM 151337]|nr:hypothetical protein [Hoyosella sp. YIM 151337]MCW4354162.1 hypothetical protein [Hoyosella sp. YIM 151337]
MQTRYVIFCSWRLNLTTVGIHIHFSVDPRTIAEPSVPAFVSTAP